MIKDIISILNAIKTKKLMAKNELIKIPANDVSVKSKLLPCIRCGRPLKEHIGRVKLCPTIK